MTTPEPATLGTINGEMTAIASVTKSLLLFWFVALYELVGT
jgi:hypothetical protein